MFGFYPFGEVINVYYQKFHLAFSRGKGAENVHSLLCKGPWGDYGVEWFLLLMDEVAMLLARYAFFDKSVVVCLHSWPKVTGSEYSGGHICLRAILLLCIGLVRL